MVEMQREENVMRPLPKLGESEKQEGLVTEQARPETTEARGNETKEPTAQGADTENSALPTLSIAIPARNSV